MGDFTLENSSYESSTRLYMKNEMNLRLFLLKQHHRNHPGFKAMYQKFPKIGTNSTCQGIASNMQ